MYSKELNTIRLDKIVSDELLERFIKVNNVENVSNKEMIREILIISKIYNNMFQRLADEELITKKATLRHVEDHLNEANNFIRDYLGIRSREKEPLKKVIYVRKNTYKKRGTK